MGRKNYFDLINEMNFNAEDEINNLIYLLEKTTRYGNTLHEFIEDNFLSYKNRTTFVSFNNMLKFIQENTFSYEEYLFVFSELLVDIFGESHKYSNNFYDEDIMEVINNITSFLDICNHELINLENGKRIIVEKNPYASEVSQIMSEDSIIDAIKVLEYNHFENKGNIERKRDVLRSLANYLEPLRKELNNNRELKEILKVKNKKLIALDSLFEMYNRFGIRHNDSNQIHLDMEDDEIENWYDDIYTSTLFIILSKEEARITRELNDLKVEESLTKRKG